MLSKIMHCVIAGNLLLGFSSIQADPLLLCRKKVKHSESSSSSSSSDHQVTRDSFGVPLITENSLEEVFESIGKLQAEDRLWQIFMITIAANGRLAEFFGPGPGGVFVESDVFQREINYTDAEVQQQIKKFFTEKTHIAYKHFLDGLNARVAEVNANPALLPSEFIALGFNPPSIPVPNFSKYDIIRAGQFVLQSFSPSSIPQYQLTNFSDLLQLIANQSGNVAEAFQIFDDVDPTSAQIKSKVTIVPGHKHESSDSSSSSSSSDCLDVQKKTKDYSSVKIDELTVAQGNVAKTVADRIKRIRAAHRELGMPKLGSNGEVIGKHKSLSGNTMLRCAIQPNFNHPSDFYQVRVDSDKGGLHGNFFNLPVFPLVGIVGVFGNHGSTIQVGQLPSNDFLFESTANIKSSRLETIKILGSPDLIITVYRSTSGGWVIQNPVSPGTMLTLRSVFIGKQLRVLNAAIEPAFSKSLKEFKDTALNPEFQSDVGLFEGEYADADSNIAAFHAGGWTKLPAEFDRRLPQGIPFNPTPSNELYSIKEIAQNPLIDVNNKQGYYVGWNSLFKQGTEASDDTIDIGLNRIYWLNDYIKSFDKLSFDDLENLTVRQALANSLHAFQNDRPTSQADLFTPLFKDRFFKAVHKLPTSSRLKAIHLLADFEGNWFDGDLDAIANSPDVSDKFILACLWALCFVQETLNPFLTGTTRQICSPAHPCTPLPTEDVVNYSYALNLASRLLGTSFDNTVFFKGWLPNPPHLDEQIVQCLDQALSILGGFAAQPWGAGKRGIYEFKNFILGTVQSMLIFNASGLYFVAEFSKKPGESRMESIIPLGESGEALGLPPVFNIHNFDQQPWFVKFQLRDNAPIESFQEEIKKKLPKPKQSCKDCKA